MTATRWSPFESRFRKRAILPDVLFGLALIALALFTYARASSLPAYDWNWSLLADFFVIHGKDGAKPGLLLTGLFTTLRVGFWTTLFALIFGGFLGAITARASALVFVPVQIYVNIFRNTPPLVILFAIYLFAGQFIPAVALENFVRDLSPAFSSFVAWIFATPTQLDRMISAIIALGLYQGAYVTEIARGSLAAVNSGQWEAARSLGFSKAQTLRLVIFPQAMRVALPPLVTQVIVIFKDTALVSLISLPDLTFQSLEIMAISSLTFEIWFSACVLYLILAWFFAAIGRFAEKFFAIDKF